MTAGAADPAPARGARIWIPIGLTSNPSPATQSMKFGGTHIRTLCPSSRTSRASATTGCKSPRVPTEEMSMRIVSVPRLPRARKVTRKTRPANF